MKNFRRIATLSFVQWIPLAALAIMVIGAAYGMVQQNYRSSADDPQVQMARDARNALMNGATPQSLVPKDQIDIAQSLAPFLCIFDTNGQLVAASATLHGQPIALPHGVFDSARTMGEDTITWMPEQGVRNAIAVVHYPNGYVMAGRSLQLVEDRESNLDQIALLAGAATLIFSYGVIFITRWLAQRFKLEG